MRSQRKDPASGVIATFLERAKRSVASQFAARSEFARPSAAPVAGLGGRLTHLLDELTTSLRRGTVVHERIAWSQDWQALHGARHEPPGFDLEASMRELAVLRECILDLIHIHEVDAPARELDVMAKWFEAVSADACEAYTAAG
jgi:hypothetical protein